MNRVKPQKLQASIFNITACLLASSSPNRILTLPSPPICQLHLPQWHRGGSL
jgi:hypothetical protein